MRVLPPHLAEPVRWAYRAGWRPIHPQGRRSGLHTWVDADNRLIVELTPGGHLHIHQSTTHGWTPILFTQAGCWQHVLDALTVYGILPRRFNTAYQRGVDAVSTLTITRERLRAMRRTDLLVWFAAIDNSLRNGNRMSGGNFALHLLCEAAGVNADELDFDPNWSSSPRTFEVLGLDPPTTDTVPPTKGT